MYSTVKKLHLRDDLVKSSLIALKNEKETLNNIIKRLEQERILIQQMLEFHRINKDEYKTKDTQ